MGFLHDFRDVEERLRRTSRGETDATGIGFGIDDVTCIRVGGIERRRVPPPGPAPMTATRVNGVTDVWSVGWVW
jgi:hypothetical protein